MTHLSLQLRGEGGRERGWRGLSQTPRNRKSHSQHPKPPGKLAEAVQLRLDPEAPQTCRTHKVFPSRNDRTPFAALYRLSIPLAKAHTTGYVMTGAET